MNSVLDNDFIQSALSDGQGYIVSSYGTIDASETFNLHIRNPHDDKIMFLINVFSIIEGDASVEIHDTFDSTSNGTEITIQNSLLDSGAGAPDSGPFEAYQNSNFTVVSEDSTIPAGFTVAGAVRMNAVSIYPSIVEPEREIIFEVDGAENNQVFIGALLLTSY